MAHTRVVHLDLMPVGEEPPSEFRILGAGPNKSRKGVHVFDEHSATAVLQEYADHGAELFIDYEHSFGKAAGWFKPEIRDGELWASEVTWTPQAQEALRAKEYRYFSPALLQEVKTNRVVRLVNVALTNIPALAGLKPLVAAEETDMGSPQETATVEGTERDTLLTTLGVRTLQEGIGKIQGLLELPAKLAAKETELSEALGKLAAYETGKREAEVATLLDAAIKEHRVLQSERAHLLDQGVKNIDWMKGYLPTRTPMPSAQPPVRLNEGNGASGGNGGNTTSTTSTVTLSAADEQALKFSGLSREAFIKQREQELAGGAQ